MAYRVLFIDDDEFIRKIYADRFAASGIDATLVGSAADAESTWEKQPFDLICTDYVLADKSGLDIVKELRAKFGAKLPILVFSASGQDAQIAEIMAAGATQYVQKDHVVPTELMETIKKHIDDSRA